MKPRFILKPVRKIHKYGRFFVKIVMINDRYFLILCVMTLIILPVVCSFLQNSVFHIESRNQETVKKYMRYMDRRRLNESLKIINKFRKTKDSNVTSTVLPYWKPNKNVDIGLTIITMARNRHSNDPYKPKYLTQVVGQLLALLNNTSGSKSYAIFLCNVDNEPEIFTEISYFSEMLKTFQRFQQKTIINVNIFEKEKQDYLFCLNKTMNQNVTYTFLIEDDAYPDPALFSVLEHVIDHRIENKHLDTRLPSRNVTYLKFYHLPNVLGYWSIEVERIPELISVSLFLGTVLCQVYVYIIPNSKLHIYTIWFLCVLYICLVAMSIGRQNLLQLRHLSKYFFLVTPAPSCCTPAMLFTQYGGITLLHMMNNVTCKSGYGKDTLLDDLRYKHGLIGLMIQPNLFQHIGYYTTLRSAKLNINSLL